MENQNDDYENEDYDENDDYDENETCDFLANLESDKYLEPMTEKEQMKNQKQMDKLKKDFEKNEKKKEAQDEKRRKQQVRDEKELEKMKKTKKEPLDNDGEIYSDNATKILGRDRLIILKKINQYKSLFPNQLSKFKIKKNPSLEDLTVALEECASLVEVNTADEFMLQSIMESIKMVEGYSADTIYDIRGMSLALSSSHQFNILIKLMFVKYGMFSNVPVEYQLCMVIFSTGYLVIQKNKSKHQINAYLNETI